MEAIVALRAMESYLNVFPDEASRLSTERVGEIIERIAHGDSADHLTASALVVHLPTRRLLMHWHPRLDEWIQPGGHVEPSDTDLRSTARRELCEETGITSALAVVVGSDPLCPFDLDVHRILHEDLHGPHSHVDARYIFLTKDINIRPLGPEGARLEWHDFRQLTSEAAPKNLSRVLHKMRSFGLL